MSDTKTNFRYVIILDFESTCYNRITKEDKIELFEIIEFPSVILDTHTLEIVDTFQEYIKPIHHPKLTDYCVNLTGITQEQVDNGISLFECLQKYETWLRKNNIRKGSQEDMSKIVAEGKEDFILLTCGDWDLNTMLARQMCYEEMRYSIYPDYFKKWINIKQLFLYYYKLTEPNTSMMEMLNHLNIEHEGHHHSGIDDCRNITKIVIQMIKDGCIMKQTSNLKFPSEKTQRKLLKLSLKSKK